MFGELRLSADQVGFKNFVRHGIARGVEELAATGQVVPQLVVQATWVIAKKHVIAPLFVSAGVGVERARNVRLATGVKFFFGAQFAAKLGFDVAGRHREVPLIFVVNGQRLVVGDQFTAQAQAVAARR